MSGPFRDDMTLAAARGVLRELVEDGCACPCCDHMVRVYKRRLTAVAARAVLGLYRDHGLEFGHLPAVARRHLPDAAHQGGYLVLAAHWGLMVEERQLRPDGGRAGWWRVTRVGEAWLHGQTTVQAYAHILNGQRLRFSGERITVSEALGEAFDLRELLPPPATASLFDGIEAA